MPVPRRRNTAIALRNPTPITKGGRNTRIKFRLLTTCADINRALQAAAKYLVRLSIRCNYAVLTVLVHINLYLSQRQRKTGEADRDE